MLNTVPFPSLTYLLDNTTMPPRLRNNLTGHSMARSSLLKLPEELLLNVALRVDNQGGHGLSLTCRRLRPIAREALAKKACIKPKHIWNYVALLLIYPSWSSKLTHLTLGPINDGDSNTMCAIEACVRSTRTKADFLECCAVISAAATASRIGRADLWLNTWARGADFRALGPSILFAQFSELAVLSIHATVFGDMPLLVDIFCSGDKTALKHKLDNLHIPVGRLLQHRLRGLEITGKLGLDLPTNDNWFLHESREPRLQLTAFRHLRHLIASYDHMIDQTNRSDKYIHKVLPTSLVWLRVDYCDCEDPLGSQPFVDELIFNVQAFPDMRTIELRFDCSAGELALPLGFRQPIDLVRSWQNSGRVDFVTACKDSSGCFWSVDLAACMENASYSRGPERR